MWNLQIWIILAISHDILHFCWTWSKIWEQCEHNQVLDNLGMTLDKDEIEVRFDSLTIWWKCQWVSRIIRNVSPNWQIFVQLLLDEIDVDGDGQINYEEFYTMMCTKCWLKNGKKYNLWQLDKVFFSILVIAKGDPLSPSANQFPFMCPQNLYIPTLICLNKAGLGVFFIMVSKALCTLLSCWDKCWSSRQGRGGANKE